MSVTTRAKTKIQVDARTRYESNLVSLYGPKPTNPFTHLRKSQNFTHDHLSELSFIHRLTLIKAEQGIFAEPTPALVEFWVSYYNQHTMPNDLQRIFNAGVSELAIVDRYENFQDEQRRRHHQYFGPRLNANLERDDNLHPLRQLRKRHVLPELGTLEISKALCMSQATLQHWEKKWRAQQKVPKQFQVILMTIGYTKYEVNEFNEFYMEWRQARLGH